MRGVSGATTLRQGKATAPAKNSGFLRRKAPESSLLRSTVPEYTTQYCKVPEYLGIYRGCFPVNGRHYLRCRPDQPKTTVTESGLRDDDSHNKPSSFYETSQCVTAFPTARVKLDVVDSPHRM